MRSVVFQFTCSGILDTLCVSFGVSVDPPRASVMLVISIVIPSVAMVSGVRMKVLDRSGDVAAWNDDIVMIISVPVPRRPSTIRTRELKT